MLRHCNGDKPWLITSLTSFSSVYVHVHTYLHMGVESGGTRPPCRKFWRTSPEIFRFCFIFYINLRKKYFPQDFQYKLTEIREEKMEVDRFGPGA